MFHLKKILRSFQYAIRGLVLVFREEQNFRVQTIAALVVFILMFVLETKNWEKVALILVICLVLVLELINSIFERVTDILKPRVHFYVEAVKDLMAAAVLLASLAALAVGLIIFIPYLIRGLNSSA